MKKIAIFLLPLIFIGCVIIEIPEQIKEEFHYKRIVNAGFDASVDASVMALESLGWKVSNIAKSVLLKNDRDFDKTSTRLANIFTDLKQVHLFLTSSYSTFNLNVEEIDEAHTQITVRYLCITPIPPFYNKKVSYKNDKLIDKLYLRIESYLNK